MLTVMICKCLVRAFKNYSDILAREGEREKEAVIVTGIFL